MHFYSHIFLVLKSTSSIKSVNSEFVHGTKKKRKRRNGNWWDTDVNYISSLIFTIRLWIHNCQGKCYYWKATRVAAAAAGVFIDILRIVLEKEGCNTRAQRKHRAHSLCFTSFHSTQVYQVWPTILITWLIIYNLSIFSLIPLLLPKYRDQLVVIYVPPQQKEKEVWKTNKLSELWPQIITNFSKINLNYIFPHRFWSINDGHWGMMIK